MRGSFLINHDQRHACSWGDRNPSERFDVPMEFVLVRPDIKSRTAKRRRLKGAEDTGGSVAEQEEQEGEDDDEEIGGG